jgi:ADP-ribose pyrophosphatase YjhB (NUDIX family)
MLIFAVRLILEDRGNMLFLEQTKKQGGRYTLIGGNVEEEEFAREALAREVVEEAGIQVLPENMQLVHVLHRHKLKKGETSLVLYFKANKFKGQPESMEPKKFKHAIWLPLSHLPNNISGSTRHVLDCIQQNMIYSEFPTRSKVLEFWKEFGHRWAGFSDY